MPNKLEDAAESLRRSHTRALGALDSATTSHAAGLTAARRSRQGEHEKQVAIARNRAAQQVTEHTLAARDSRAALVRSADASLSAADYVSLGSLSLPGSQAGVNETVSAPLILPLIGRANLIIDGTAEPGTNVVQQVVWQALSHTALAQLDVVGFDPLLSGALAPFSGIRAAVEGALEVVSRPAELEQIIERLVTDVQRVNDTLRGLSGTLLDFRIQSGHPVERLQLVVLLNYPHGVDEQTHRQVLALAKVGPAAGISFLFFTNSQDQDVPEWWDHHDVEALGNCLGLRSGSFRWTTHPDFTVATPQIDPAALGRDIDQLTIRLASASAPSVPFTTAQPLDAQWRDSSADGVTFAIGMIGPKIVEVTLGDERGQRHNALITGAVGQGKSNLLKIIVHSLAQRYSPDELELYLLDFKEGVTLYPFAPTPGSPDYLPHARVLGLESDRDFGISVLRYIEDEFARRAKLFRPYGDNIAKYRAALPEAQMPRIVVMVDEFHLLFDPPDKTAEDAAQLLEALARRGRSYGVHIILASQTISGIAALMTRENGIFAQFPVRLALKNAVAESYATLSQGNDAAARLRMRGEAILNVDYGARDANRQVVIAAAEDEELSRLRVGWWNTARTTTPPPIVFDGGRLIRPSAAIEAIRRYRHRVVTQGTPPVAVLGFPIDVSGEPLAVSLAGEPGRNVAILGAGEKTGNVDTGDDAANNAIGALQAAALSLALQHPNGDAEFICLDFLDDVTARRSGHQDWLDLMERLGFPVRRVFRNDLVDYLKTAAEELPNLDDACPVRYLLGFGMDRAGNLETADMFAHKPVDDLQTILRDGPIKSTHLIGWWSNAATFKSQIGFGGEGYVEALLMLRLDQSAVQDLLGPFVTWSVRENRGLMFDRTQLAEPMTIVPFAPLAGRDASAFLSADWGP
jgi:S-DNA-T family DNA segregation ATPase FtsK/SpoIIIE